jgi:hypothetical protein
LVIVCLAASTLDWGPASNSVWLQKSVLVDAHHLQVEIPSSRIFPFLFEFPIFFFLLLLIMDHRIIISAEIIFRTLEVFI